MKIKLKISKSYGRTIYYPHCDTSFGLCMLNRRTPEKGKGISFTTRSLEILKKLGYEIEIIEPQKEWKA